MNSVKSGGSRGSRKSKGSNKSKTRKMFNELQRGELKIVLANKYKKKYKD
jgi:hypothetical protein